MEHPSRSGRVVFTKERDTTKLTITAVGGDYKVANTKSRFYPVERTCPACNGLPDECECKVPSARKKPPRQRGRGTGARGDRNVPRFNAREALTEDRTITFTDANTTTPNTFAPRALRDTYIHAPTDEPAEEPEMIEEPEWEEEEPDENDDGWEGLEEE